MDAQLKKGVLDVCVLTAIRDEDSYGYKIIKDLKPVLEDEESWNKIMDVTPLKKWATLEEVSDWIYFLTVINKSASGQDVLIDNGEYNLNSTFVWPKR